MSITYEILDFGTYVVGLCNRQRDTARWGQQRSGQGCWAAQQGRSSGPRTPVLREVLQSEGGGDRGRLAAATPTIRWRSLVDLLLDGRRGDGGEATRRAEHCTLPHTLHSVHTSYKLTADTLVLNDLSMASADR